MNVSFQRNFVQASRDSFREGKLTLPQLLACFFLRRRDDLIADAEQLAIAMAMQAQLISPNSSAGEVDWDSLADFLKEIIPLIIEALLQLLPLFFQRQLKQA